MSTPTHNKTTDPIRERYLSHIANRPRLDPHELECAQKITEGVTGWLRGAWRNLEGRPDLQQYLKAAGAQLNTLMQRLDEEARAGRAH